LICVHVRSLQMGIKMEQTNKAGKLIPVTNALLFMGTVIFIISLYKLPPSRGDQIGWMLCTSVAIFVYLCFCQKFKEEEKGYKVPVQNLSITSLALISENKQVVKEWSLYGKVGLVIGKSSGENQVDIDLSFTADAPFISREQALLNFCDGHWYIEDAGSKNKLEIIKGTTDRIFELTEIRPLKLDRGDIIRMNETALMLR
jgi:hypothetical protein